MKDLPGLSFLDLAFHFYVKINSINFQGDGKLQNLPHLFSAATIEQSAARVASMRAVIERTPILGVAGALRGMAIRPDRSSELVGISVPTLVMVGEDDLITPPDEARSLAARIPDGRLHVIPHTGHLAPYENPSLANALILDFLRGLNA